MGVSWETTWLIVSPAAAVGGSWVPQQFVNMG